MPRRARYLIPRGLPRRGEFIAACAVLVVLTHLLFAQLTLILAVAFYLTGKATRWRAYWLVVPAVMGAVWTLALGPRAAAAGFAAGPARITAYLGASGHQADHILHPAAAFAGAGGWLPRQLPLALLTGAAEAGLALWLSWLHTDEWDLPRPRPGLLVAFRRVALTRRIRAGGVVTRDGTCLGVAPGDGARVGLSWREVTGGVLVCGSPVPDTLATSFQLVHAALRRRKPVLAVDLTGDPAVPGLLAGACAAAGFALRVLGGPVAGAQPACYDPFRHGTPSHRAALVAGMVNWDGPRTQFRRGCVAYLEDVFELLDAAPGDPRVPVLDEVLHLLNPAALRARAQHVPGVYARRAMLAERTGVSASLIDAEPATTAPLTAALRALRVAEQGRMLRQPVGGQLASVDLGQVVSARAAVLFRLPPTRPPATPATTPSTTVTTANGAGPDPDCGTMITRLICQDLLGLSARLRGIGVDADGLVWLTGCEAIEERALAALIAAGAAAGLPVVATTGSVAAAADLAEHPNALIVHRIAEPAAGRRLAAVAAPRLVAAPVPAQALPDPQAAQTHAMLPGGNEMRPPVTAADLAMLADDEFMLAVARPRRIVPRALAVRPRETQWRR